MKIKTICRDCIFAEWEQSTIPTVANEENISYQTGCSIGRLEKFQELYPEKVSLEQEDNKEFYAIHRVCNYCRNQEWADKNPDKDAIETIKKEIAPKVDFLVIGDNEEELTTSIKSVLRQTLPPNSIVVLCKDRYVCEDIRQFLRKNAGCIKFLVSYMFDEEREYSDLINDGVRQCKGTMYSVLTYGAVAKIDMIEKIDHLINEEMKQPLVIYNPDGDVNGLTVSRRIHEMLGGNGKYNIVSKVQQLAEEEDRMDMLISWEDIYANAGAA